MENRANKNNNNRDAIYGLLGLVLGVPYLVMITAVWLMFRPCKQRISKGLGLKAISASWRGSPGAFLGALELFGLVATICTVMMGYRVWTINDGWQAAFGTIALWTLLGIGFGFVHLILWWVKQYHEDPSLQKALAGQEAERIVAQAIERFALSVPGSVPMHNTLMVFNQGLENEFSAEADHILLTDCQLYFFETKRKSGTVFVEPTAATWRVQKKNGTEETMRNALLQAKSTVRVLRKQFGFNFKIVPIVVLVGETAVVDAVSNVLVVDDLSKILEAFEKTARADGLGGRIDAREVAEIILASSADPAGPEMEKHILRAASAREMSEAKHLVDSASVE